jgi:hypothetical protein
VDQSDGDERIVGTEKKTMTGNRQLILFDEFLPDFDLKEFAVGCFAFGIVD